MALTKEEKEKHFWVALILSAGFGGLVGYMTRDMNWWFSVTIVSVTILVLISVYTLVVHQYLEEER